MKTYQGKYAEEINLAALHYGLCPFLIAAIIKEESGFDSMTKSPLGGRGLMQLMPKTVEETGVKDAFDPKQNIMGGARYISESLKKNDENIYKALIAYSAGERNVERIYGSMKGEWKSVKEYIKDIATTYKELSGQELSI